MATKNYTYRVWPLDPGPVHAQLQAGHQYRNRLVELEHQRRAAVAAVLAEHCPEWVEIEARYAAAVAETEALGKQLGAARAQARDRTAGGDLAAKLKAARAGLKAVRAERKRIKQASFARDDVQAARAATTVAHRAARKAARAATTAYWGTYLIVEDAAKDFGKGAPPRFQAWRGNGALAVQLQHGLAERELCAGSDTRLQLRRTSGGHKDDRELWVRIGSEGRAPVWARFRIRWHRDLPPGALIKWCRISRSLVGTQVHWHAMLTLDAPAEPTPEAPADVVAVHCGWRTMPDGTLRVATIRGSDGAEWEERLNLAPLDHLAALQSHRDQWFNTAKARLKAWCAAAEKRGLTVPGWLAELLPHLHAWRSPERLWRVAERVHCEGFAGDERLCRYLDWWRSRKDRHLANWIAHRRSRLLNHRTDFYRVLAARLAEQYQQVALLDIDWTQLLRQTDVTSEDYTASVALRNARFAAPGLLTRCLREKFGARVIEVASKHVTATCHECGAVEEWDRQRREHTCSACGRRWDQDANAVRNQLASAQVARVAQGTLAAEAAQGVSDAEPARKLSARQQRFRAARERRQKGQQEKELE